MSNNFEDAHPLEDRVSINFDNLHHQEERKNTGIFKGRTILLVDDNEDIIALITCVLKIYGIRVITASCGSEAFEIVKKVTVDLLISDIDMAGNSGYLLIKKIRTLASSPIREIPAIAFSDRGENRAYKQALACGFQSYMKKPSNPTQLITEVAKLLGRSCKRNFSLFGDYSCLGER
ncbi:response regulator [Desmonostoc muscorum LEGE 12446]|uniref:Response regulator n=1 Tax=Desmonostoc muscorum LEGE 12446 TaxID=1828758 RepID=A0A8J6ZW93_DESMC|nr:response regulator [Desmonostoc muscorum]MCF2145331.1 response regulator [Desmonostoc muscorum LEGE 12446]